MSKKTEYGLGFVFLGVVLFVGKSFLASDMLFFRLMVGLALGYTLTRAATGFAGSVNRAYNTGSTRLMKTLMFMFFISAVLTAAIIFNADPESYGLWINPISVGLLVGGTLFGFGMAFSSCCASGVLTDIITGLPRGVITLIFFSMGVFLGHPLEKLSWVNDSFFSSSSMIEAGKQGVFFPDFFKFDGFNGYLGAIILTGLLASLVVVLSNYYESYRKKNKTYSGHFGEKAQDKVPELSTRNYNFLSITTYQRVFVQSWNLKTGAIVIALIFAILMGVTGSGWGASGPYGIWFGKFLMLFGFSAESLAAYTGKSVEFFTNPFFANGTTVQNIGILLGTVVYLLTSGKFKTVFMSEMHINLKQGLLYALGGMSMGVGTRLAKGCNVGALYTPIANFSMAGWVFLVVMVVGGVLGNMFAKKILR